MSPSRFNDAGEYRHSDLASKYRSTAGSQTAVDPALLDELTTQLERDGFVIIRDLLSAQQLKIIKDEAERLLTPLTGRNNFEGEKTQRLYSVIEKTLGCNPLVEHPIILGLLDRILQPNYLLSQLQMINILPGEAQQPIHYDDGFYPIARPRPAYGAATVWAISDFTENNGATVTIPGSHKWGDKTPSDTDTQIPAIMPAGSVIFFLGTLWHGGGENRSPNNRLAVTAQYCEPWCRPQENFSLSTSIARVKQCSEHIQRLLGYSIHPPFMGFVDGKHPKRLLED
ncbi:MAG: phytanoyl-CoA dioxygenase family protein [Cellvibrionaceae bacterium]